MRPSRRSGILRVDSISDVFYMAEVLAKQPRPNGNRMTIVTNAGGPGVLATDALISGGGELAEISDDTMNELNTFLPSGLEPQQPDRYSGGCHAGTLRPGAGNSRPRREQRRPARHPHAAGYDRPDRHRRGAA